MNVIRLENEGVEICQSDCGFCAKRLKGQVGGNCIQSLSKETRDIGICRYGFSFLKGFRTVLCGVRIPDYVDVNLIHEHQKRGRLVSSPEIDLKTAMEWIKVDRLSCLCDQYSRPTHDMANYIGNLRSHLENYQKYYRGKYNRIDQVALRSKKFVKAWEQYSHQPRYQVPEDWFARFNELPAIIDQLSKRVLIYQEFLSEIEKVCEEIRPFVDDAVKTHEEELVAKQHGALISLLAMPGLFAYRLQYFLRTIATLFKEEFLKTKPAIHQHNMHQTLKKLINIVGESARLMEKSFVLSGFSNQRLRVSDDLYLAIYILLENAAKYAWQGSTINVFIRDIDNVEPRGCLIEISNKSEQISEEDLTNLSKAGFIGSNARNKNSQGLGLSIVSSIVEQSGGEVSFDYNETDSLFIASLLVRSLENPQRRS